MTPLQFNLVGWSHYSFTADDGKFLEGYKFHVVRPSMKSGFNGNEAAVLSVSEQLVQACGDPQTGRIYECMYDQKGRLASYKAVSPAGPQKA